MYLHSKIIDFLNTLNITAYPNQWERQVKEGYPNLYKEVLNYTQEATTPSFVEKLYRFTNKITVTPKCKMCDKSVTYSSRKKSYHTYCGRNCSIKDMKTLLGVDNTSQLQSVKDKKKKSALLKYGVDNVSKSLVVKQSISKKAIERWEDIYKESTLLTGVTIKDYHRLVKRFTEKSYREHKNTLDPNNTRSEHWHVDHKFSIHEGFKHKIDPEIIGHISNLQMLDRHTNSTIKNKKCSITLKKLLNEYQSSIGSN